MSGVLHGVVAALKSAAAAATDAFFNYVTLLLPGSGTNGAQNNTFLDGSSNNFTVTRNGNTTQGTFSPYGANWSNYFDGSGDYLTVPSNAAFDFGTGDFTIEFWVYWQNISSFPMLFARTTTGTSGWFFQTSASNAYFGALQGTRYGTWTVSLANNTWTHVALTRTGSSLEIFINGVSQTVKTVTGAELNNDAAAPVWIGDFDNTTPRYPLQGYLSNYRIVKGSRVYTANFTPPTAPLTAITNTSLLTCQSNRFIDNSTNAFTVTRNGDVTVQVFSPFSPTAAYSTSVIGGSGYFDGSGDYLTTPNNAAMEFGSGAFTIECWFYTTTSLSNFQPFLAKNNAVSRDAWVLQSNRGTANTPAFVATSQSASWDVELISSTAYLLNTWNHIAAARSGNTFSLFLNGARVATTTSSITISNNTAATSIGAYSAGDFPITGYVSNARIVKGTAVYDPTLSTLTVPTAPLTAITNTSLLLNFTNAGVIDNAMMNDMETVGNAQISNAQAKWGSTSISFDGTGDWLLMPNAQPQQLGTANFTVEGWIRLNAINTAYGVISKGTATTGWSVNITSGNKLQFSYTATQLTGATSLAANTWYHFAVVRNGTGTGNLKIYLDGVSDATSASAVTDNFNQTNSMYVGANRTGGEALNGYVQDARITNGVARYTANFTPPTAAFPLN